jgi:hypothetical protein
MPDRAHITSVETLDEFRANLIIYLTKARTTLDDVNSEVLHTMNWLQNDQRAYWQQQVRRRSKALEHAQQELFGARLSDLRHSADAEQAAARRARQALEEAQDKVRLVRRWSREFDSRIEPLAKQMDSLRNILSIDMKHAVAYLGQVIKTLADYAGIAPPQEPAGLSSSADADTASEDPESQRERGGESRESSPGGNS